MIPNTYRLPNNFLVVASQPHGQIDIKIVLPIFGISAGDWGERTVPVIDYQYEHFQKDLKRKVYRRS
jgi:hypothetical protein